MPKLICDRISYAITNREYTDEGFLRVPGHVARTGIQRYLASELGLTDREPNEIIKVYRPYDEVFSDESLKSYLGVDVTIEHPSEMVNADNYNTITAGVVTTCGSQDGDFVRTDLLIKSKDAIKAVENGKVQLSAGYTAEYVPESGNTPTGESYDYVQRDIRINHVALVDRARAGGQARIFDKQGAPTMPRITLDSGRSVEVENEATATLLSDAFDRMNGTIDSQKAIIDGQNDEIESLKAKTNDAAIKQRVSATVTALDSARSLVPGFTTDSMDVTSIQREVLSTLHPKRDFTDKSEAYIAGAFETAVETIDADMSKLMKDMCEKYDMSEKQMKDKMGKEYGMSEEDMNNSSKMMDAMKKYDMKMSKERKNSNDSHNQLAGDIGNNVQGKTERKSALDSYKSSIAKAHLNEEA